MNVFDLVILAILALLTLRGIWKGMVSQIVSVASIFVCWIVATRFGSLVAPTIPVEPPWNQVLAMAIVFVITWIAIRFASAALEKIIKHWHLEKLNKLLGGALGFTKGLLLCLIITFFSVMVSETSRDVVFNSQSGFHMVKLITRIGVFVPKDSYEFVHTQLAYFQDKVDEAVPGKTPETVQVQSSETMQQLLEQFQQKTGQSQTAERTQTTEKTPSGAGSLLTALSQWWNGTKEESSPVETAVSAVQTVAAQTFNTQTSGEETRPQVAAYTPPPPSSMLPQMSSTDIPFSVTPPLATPLSTTPQSATPQPLVAAEEFFIQRPAAPASSPMQQLTPLVSVPIASQSESAWTPLTTLTPLSESLLISPEPMELLPIMPTPHHIGSDLLLRNSTQPASSDVPARVFRPQ